MIDGRATLTIVPSRTIMPSAAARTHRPAQAREVGRGATVVVMVSFLETECL